MAPALSRPSSRALFSAILTHASGSAFDRLSPIIATHRDVPAHAWDNALSCALGYT